MAKGLFITFEGGEGSGKSTQVSSLKRRLRRRDIPVTVIREPGGTSLGDRLRRLLKFSDIPLIPEAELLLFNASRAQLVSEVIRPALERGDVALCDRFADSTVAYQGYGRGISLDRVEAVNNVATGGMTPDMTFFLDVPPAEGMRRRSTTWDRFELGFEQQDVTDFHGRVHQGYVQMARREPDRWLVIDASQSPRQVSRLIWQAVEPMLKNTGLQGLL